MDSNEPIYFECGQCGDCCSSWNIPIEGDKARILMQKPWVQERLTHVRRSFVRMSHDLYRIPLSDENVCVFLSDDRRCLVQANEGPALKPLECRRFPFAAIRLSERAEATAKMPVNVAVSTDRIRYETSAACKKISESLLLAFRPVVPTPSAYQAAMLSTSLPETSQPDGEARSAQEALSSAERPYLDYHETFEVVEALPDHLPVAPFRKNMPRENYETWCAHLRTVFMDPTASPEAALREAARSLEQLARYPQRALQVPTAFTKGGFSPRRSHWLLLTLLRKPYRTWSWIQLLRGKRYDDPRLFGVSVDLRVASRSLGSLSHLDNPMASRSGQTPAEHNLSESEHLLKAFLFNLLCRRLSLARGMSLTAWVAVTVCACLLVRWYATMLVGLRLDTDLHRMSLYEPLHPEPSDVSLAIRLVERYYTGHQPRFLQVLQSPWKSALINRFFLR